MNTTISNKIYIQNPTKEIKDWVYNNLILVNPKYETMCRIGKENEAKRMHIPQRLNLFIKKGNTLIISTGCLYGIWQYLKKDIVNTDFAPIYQIKEQHFISDNAPKLYDYQEKAVNSLLKAKGGILQAGCGAGKTIMSCELFKRIGQRTLFLVHTGDLLRQAKQNFISFFPLLKIGEITDGKVNIGEDITFATWQTMCKIDRDIYMNYFNVIIVDEVQHCVSSPTQIKHLGQIVDISKARYIYGLSATPYRADTMTNALYSIIGLNPQGEFKPTYIVDRQDTNTLTALHLEIDLKTPISYEYMDTDGKMIYSELIDYLSSNQDRQNAIINKIVECQDREYINVLQSKKVETLYRKQMVLCNLVKQAQDLVELINSKTKLKAVLLIGKVGDSKRQKILNDKLGKEWDVIVATYSLAKEGLDLPILSALHLATPQKDKSTIIQSVGRIERAYDKGKPVVFDYVDTNIPYCVSAFRKRKRIIKNRL